MVNIILVVLVKTWFMGRVNFIWRMARLLKDIGKVIS